MRVSRLPLCLVLCCAFVLPGVSVQGRVMDGNVIMDQPMRENLCALTFDDGPSPYTPYLLDMLAEYGIPATFLLLGRQAERYPETVRRMLNEGHEVGSHSYSHPNLRHLSQARKEAELRRTDAILRGLGAQPAFFRPPYGAYDSQTEKIAEGLGLSILLWSLDTRDWKRLPDNYANLRSTRGTTYAPGTLRGVFLFHDTHKRTVDDLPRVIRDLRAGGCQRFVTVSDYFEGLTDPEPGLRMTRVPSRHAVPGDAAPAPQETATSAPAYPAGTAPLPLARSSRPWDRAAKEAADPLPAPEQRTPVPDGGQQAAPDGAAAALPLM